MDQLSRGTHLVYAPALGVLVHESHYASAAGTKKREQRPCAG